jgi:ring-1,2-phenylacetyl-CoA epoxidase subunit PaaB
MDTQWPRFIVFQQEGPDASYQYDGSVHAPDAEIALLNARDVFTRRPACTGLWVVRADRIFTRTIEELAADPDFDPDFDPYLSSDSLPSTSEAYSVFQKRDHRGVHSFVGEVEALSPADAMRKAMTAYQDEKAIVWWVCPTKAITRSGKEDVEALFQMADAPRFYREQDEFKTLTALRKAAGKIGDKAANAS